MPDIIKLTIKNFGGIEEAVLTPGKVNIIKGKNGAGKTTVINSLINAFGGGHHAELIRNGAEKAEIGIEFDNGMSIEKQITAGKTDLKVTDDKGNKIKKAPQSVLNDKFKLFSVNPLELMNAPEKYRTELLLEAMPIKVEEKQIQEIISKLDIELTYNLEAHGLEVLSKLRKQIFEERTTNNRMLDMKKKTIEHSIINALDFDVKPDEVIAQYDAAIAKLDEMEEKRLNYIKNINEKQTLLLEQQNAEHSLILQEAINKVNEEHASQVAKIKDEYQEKLSQMEESYKLKSQPIIAEKLKLSTIKDNLAAIRAQENQLENDKKEAQSFQKASDDLSEALKNLDKIKKELESTLPIPGLEVIEGKMFKNSVPFDNLNTAEQMKVCIEIGKLHNTSGLMIVDGIERWDEANQQLFIEQAKLSGIQLIMTEVSDDVELEFTEVK